MKKHHLSNSLKLILAAAAIPISVGALAGETVELKLSGIIRPSACSISMPNSTASYEEIMFEALLENEINFLGQKDFEINISCPEPTQIGLTNTESYDANNQFMLKSNISRTDWNQMTGKQLPEDPYNVKVSSSSNHIIGQAIGYLHSVTSPELTDLELLRRARASETLWRNVSTDNINPIEDSDIVFSWGNSGVSVKPITNMSLTLSMITALYSRHAISENLPNGLNEALDYNGRMSLTMVYL